MTPLPDTESTPVLRTDFQDEAAWVAVCAAIVRPVGEFRAYVEFVDDRQYEGVVAQQILSLTPRNYRHSLIFVVDRETLNHPDQPILVVDLNQDSGRSFRVIPSAMWSVENNLSLANMDFEEFAESVDPDGIFRGFRDP